MTGKKFKILYCTGSIASKGGVERVLSTKTFLFAEKYDIDVHISTLDGKDPAYSFSGKIKFHNVTPQKIIRYKIPLLTNYLIKKDLYNNYKHLIRDISPNVVIVLERGTDDFYLPHICHDLNIPIVREFHFAQRAVYEYSKLMPPLKQFFYRLNYKRIFSAFNNYDWLVLLTKKDQSESNYKCKTIVIPNIVIRNDNSKNSSLNNNIAISVGSMHDQRKGFLELIKIWEEIKNSHPEWSLHIYGGGSIESELKQYVCEHNLSDYIKVCGVCNNIESKYAESSVFLAASIAEGLPMVLIEAMSQGVPCLSYDTPTGPSDIITDGIDGKIIPYRDKEQFKQELLNIMDNPQILRAWGNAAVIKSHRFSEDVIIPQWLNFFKNFGYNGN